MNQPPEHIAPAKFCGSGIEFSGQVSLQTFPRLVSMLASEPGEVSIGMRGQLDPVGRPLLRGHVKGALPLVCQTCFGVMHFNVDHDFTLCVVDSEADADDYDGEEDPVVCEGGELSTLELFEDELILSLPVVANHPAEQCQVSAALLRQTDETETAEPSRPNPFGVLLDLKKSGKT